jgi:hypothetical protein
MLWLVLLVALIATFGMRSVLEVAFVALLMIAAMCSWSASQCRVIGR